MNGLAFLAATALALTPVAGATRHDLPLRRGVYDEPSAGCRGPTVSRSWFGGGYLIQHPHARCEFRSVIRLGPRRYAVGKTCYEYGDHLKRFDVIDRIRIVSRDEYRLDNRFGRFHARWCHD